MRQLSVFILLSGLLLFGSPEPQTIVRYNINRAELDAENDKKESEGYRLTDLSVYIMDGYEHYAAIWNKQTGPETKKLVGLYDESFGHLLTQYKSLGYCPVRLSSTSTGQKVFAASVLSKTSLDFHLSASTLPDSLFLGLLNSEAKNGNYLIDFTFTKIGTLEQYLLVWGRSAARISVPNVRLDLSSSQYESELASQSANGYKPARVSRV